jgi:hypothetical protein
MFRVQLVGYEQKREDARRGDSGATVCLGHRACAKARSERGFQQLLPATQREVKRVNVASEKPLWR